MEENKETLQEELEEKKEEALEDNNQVDPIYELELKIQEADLKLEKLEDINYEDMTPDEAQEYIALKNEVKELKKELKVLRSGKKKEDDEKSIWEKLNPVQVIYGLLGLILSIYPIGPMLSAYYANLSFKLANLIDESFNMSDGLFNVVNFLLYLVYYIVIILINVIIYTFIKKNKVNKWTMIVVIVVHFIVSLISVLTIIEVFF